MWFALAQIEEGAKSIDLRPALTIAAVVAAIGIGGASMLWAGRRREIRFFRRLREERGFARIYDSEELTAIGETIRRLFAELRMVVRQVRVVRVYRAPSGLREATVVHARLGLDRGNQDSQSLDKVILLLRGFSEPLPEFVLLPGGTAGERIEKGGIFPPVSLFSKHNTVVGADPPAIRSLLNAKVQDRLIPNRDMVIRGGVDALAFYAHGTRILPHDGWDFFARCLALSKLMQ